MNNSSVISITFTVEPLCKLWIQWCQWRFFNKAILLGNVRICYQGHARFCPFMPSNVTGPNTSICKKVKSVRACQLSHKLETFWDNGILSHKQMRQNETFGDKMRHPETTPRMARPVESNRILMHFIQNLICSFCQWQRQDSNNPFCQVRKFHGRVLQTHEFDAQNCPDDDQENSRPKCKLTKRPHRHATVFVDHHSCLSYVHVHETTNADDAIAAKRAVPILLSRSVLFSLCCLRWSSVLDICFVLVWLSPVLMWFEAGSCLGRDTGGMQT